MKNLPHVTVATVVFHQGKFLLVKELDGNRLVYNQPAGHVEPGESIPDAAIRETLEETGWEVALEAFLGVYQHYAQHNDTHYVRHCFVARPQSQFHDSPLDSDIEAAVWLTPEEILGLQDELRSPMVLRAIEDFLNTPHFPLAIFKA